MIRLLSVLMLAGALAAAAPPKHPPRPQASPSPGAPATPQPWKLVTDQLHANLKTGRFSAPHHVTMTRADGSTIVADRASGNYKEQKAALFGHVTVHDASGTFGLNSAQGTQASSRGPATLSADELKLDDKTRLYDASGNVHFTQGDTTLDAKTAHLNDATHILDLAGKVHVVQGNRTLDAERATYNTQIGSGEANQNVVITFPGITPTIATPKPIKIPGSGKP